MDRSPPVRDCSGTTLDPENSHTHLKSPTTPTERISTVPPTFLCLVSPHPGYVPEERGRNLSHKGGRFTGPLGIPGEDTSLPLDRRRWRLSRRRVFTLGTLTSPLISTMVQSGSVSRDSSDSIRKRRREVRPDSLSRDETEKGGREGPGVVGGTWRWGWRWRSEVSSSGSRRRHYLQRLRPEDGTWRGEDRTPPLPLGLSLPSRLFPSVSHLLDLLFPSPSPTVTLLCLRSRLKSVVLSVCVSPFFGGSRRP